MDKEVLSVKELAYMLGVSIPTAYALVKSPDFPKVKIGGRIVIPRASLKEWLLVQSNKEGADEG